MKIVQIVGNIMKNSQPDVTRLIMPCLMLLVLIPIALQPAQAELGKSTNTIQVDILTGLAGDFDGDGIENSVDEDDDNDGQLDRHEITCGSNPFDNTSMSADYDGDNLPDCFDLDDDNDGVAEC